VTANRISLGGLTRVASEAVSSTGDRAALARSRAAAQGRIRWELLSLLVRKDLKVKYQGSAIGFAWSLANPLILLGIYFVIFTYVFPSGVADYAVYLMAGLLPFTCFSQGVSGASGSVVGSAGLVKKVSFPRLVLPLSAVGFAVVQFLLQLALLLVIVLVTTPGKFGPQTLLIVPALGLLLVFSTALAVLVSALNVRWRDTSHFVELAMLVWFWANPILYRAGLVKDHLEPHGIYWVYFLNPVATVVATFQRAVYRDAYSGTGASRKLVLADPGYLFYFRNLAIGLVISGVLLALALKVFNRLQADFAEDL
jgi:ABC-2 type transport system permease protein